MRGDVSSLQVERGGMLDVANLMVTASGLKRRPVLVDGAGGDTVDWPPIVATAPYFSVDGTQKLVVCDQKFMYTLADSTGYTAVYDTYDTGTIAVSGTTVTLTTGSFSTGDVEAGDIIVLDADGSGDGPETAEIASITDATHCELTAAPTGTFSGGTDFEARKAFKAAEPYWLDWVTGVYDGSAMCVVFADGYHTPLAYNGTTFTAYDAAITAVPRCLGFFMDRLFMGGYVDGGVDYRQGVIWSKTSDLTDFPGDYLDLPYVPGYMMRMVPLGNTLMAYFSDSVWVGTRTQGFAGDTLPVAFNRIDYSGVGLLGPRAVVAGLGGHFAVLKDNVYFVSANGVEPVGDRVVEQTVRRCSTPYKTQAALDVANDSVVFGFAEDSENISKLWRFNWKSKEWSYDELNLDYVGHALYSVGALTYGTWAATPESTGTLLGTEGESTITGSGTQFLSAGVLDGAKIFVDTLEDGRYVTEYTVDGDASAEDTLTIVEELAEDLDYYSYYIVNPANSIGQLPYASYGAIGADLGAKDRLLVAQSAGLYVLSASGTADADGTTPTVRIETPDYDGDAPDKDKFWSRLSLKIQELLSVDLDWVVQYSTTRGRSWQSAGTLKIVAGEDEGFIGFRATGSHIRFRLTCGTVGAEQYVIEEMVFKVFAREVEYNPGD